MQSFTRRPTGTSQRYSDEGVQCFDSDGERGDPRVGQPSYFLAETLKYLLLTFEPELHGMEKLQLDDVVFTTEAHPLSIQPLMCGPPDRRHPW